MKIDLNFKTTDAPTKRLIFTVDTNLVVNFLDETLATARKVINKMISEHLSFWISISVTKLDFNNDIHCVKHCLGVVSCDDGKWNICKSDSVSSDNVAVNFKTVGILDSNYIEPFITKIISGYIT